MPKRSEAEQECEHGHVHHDWLGARRQDRRRLAAALALAAVVLVAEVIGGVLSGSLALLSDAGHVATDLSAQILSLVALVLATRPADDRRTFGYYRLEILAALANGLLLVALAGFLFHEAIARLAAPQPVRSGLMLAVAVPGLLANLGGALLLRHSHTLNARSAYLHVLSDTLASVGVVAGGVIMLLRRGLYILDPILGLLIACLVIISAFRLLREAVDVLLEAVPGSIDLGEVERRLRAVPGVGAVHDLHIWTISSGVLALSAHVIACGASPDDVLGRVHRILATRYRITHSTIQVEGPAHAGDCQHGR